VTLVLGLAAGAVIAGAAAFIVGALDEETSQRAYRVLLQNFLLWAGLSQGALALSAGIRLTNGRWAGPIHRLIDSLGAFVPVSLLIFLVVWTGRRELFDWIEHPDHIQGKEWWYSEGFVFGRNIVALGWMTIISGWYLFASQRPHLGHMRGKVKGFAGPLIDRWTAGWRGADIEHASAERRCRKLAAVLALSYAFAYSTIGMDMVMGLSPHWISTMFPAYYAWGGFLSAVSMTAFLAIVLRSWPALDGQVTESRRHDLGKMVFAFSIFWMYLFWSQYLVIWYGNIPEETGFIGARLGSQFLQDTWFMDGFWERISEPYVRVTLITWFLCWVIPFWVLLGQRPKKTPAILGTVALGSLIGFWLERFILVTPSLVTPELIARGIAEASPLGILEILIAAGFVGLFFLCFYAFAQVFPGVLRAPQAGES
jgi:hypothetical protein